MSEWIPIDFKLSHEAYQQEPEGVQINLFMSPFDVPRFVRGYFDQSSRRFVIEFRYIGEEPSRREEGDQKITLRIGKNSGRLYGIEVDVEKLQINKVQLRMHISKAVNQAIENKVHSLQDHRVPPRLDRRANFEAAKKALIQAEDKVFAEI